MMTCSERSLWLCSTATCYGFELSLSLRVEMRASCLVKEDGENSIDYCILKMEFPPLPWSLDWMRLNFKNSSLLLNCL